MRIHGNRRPRTGRCSGQAFDERLESAVGRLLVGHDANTSEAMRAAIRKALGEPNDRNTQDDAANVPSGGSSRPGVHLVADMAASDEEMPVKNRGPMKLQRILHKMSDAAKAGRLIEHFQSTGQVPHVQRLQELAHDSTDHNWLWRIGEHSPDRLSPDEFVTAMSLRLGVPVMSDDRLCSYCGETALDAYGHHSLVCAGAEATRGHTDVKDKLLDLALKADPAAEAEPVSLIQSQPRLRPADVLTAGAAQGTIAALDVGATAPSGLSGDTDCTELYKNKKLRKYGRHFAEFAKQGVQYMPLIWSSWGRPHADCTAVLRNLACRAARRRGLTSGQAIYAHSSAAIGVALQRRACRMLHACIGDGGPGEDEENNAQN